MGEKPTTFTETLDAFEAAKVATKLANERFQISKAEWAEIEARHDALSIGGGSLLTRIIGLVRRLGPKAAAIFGGPAVGATGLAALTPDGTFIGESGVLSIILQALEW
tara:strand:- start:6440 stop:6763 length:324 start_codon:yes stop_codon:yes gene_type:complete